MKLWQIRAKLNLILLHCTVLVGTKRISRLMTEKNTEINTMFAEKRSTNKCARGPFDVRQPLKRQSLVWIKIMTAFSVVCPICKYTDDSSFYILFTQCASNGPVTGFKVNRALFEKSQFQIFSVTPFRLCAACSIK